MSSYSLSYAMFHERCCRPFKRDRHGHMYATPYTGSHLPSCKKLQEAFEARQVLFPRPSGHISWCFSQEQRELADAHSAKVNEAAWDPRMIRMQGPKLSRATTWWSCDVWSQSMDLDGFHFLVWFVWSILYFVLVKSSSTGFHGCPGSGFETFGAASTGHQLAKP